MVVVTEQFISCTACLQVSRVWDATFRNPERMAILVDEFEHEHSDCESFGHDRARALAERKFRQSRKRVLQHAAHIERNQHLRERDAMLRKAARHA